MLAKDLRVGDIIRMAPAGLWAGLGYQVYYNTEYEVIATSEGEAHAGPWCFNDVHYPFLFVRRPSQEKKDAAPFLIQPIKNDNDSAAFEAAQSWVRRNLREWPYRKHIEARRVGNTLECRWVSDD